MWSVSGYINWIMTSDLWDFVFTPGINKPSRYLNSTLVVDLNMQIK